MKKTVIIQIIQIAILLIMVLQTTSLQAQDCNSAISKTAPNNRYHDHGDGTVSDRLTGRMWMKCSIGQSGRGCRSGRINLFTWDLAMQQVEILNSRGGFAGYSDWRLPNITELRSLLELACWRPTINTKYFPNTPSLYYWSSSSYTYHSDVAWYVNFYYGYSYLSYRSYRYAIRLVRGGQ